MKKSHGLQGNLQELWRNLSSDQQSKASSRTLAQEYPSPVHAARQLAPGSTQVSAYVRCTHPKNNSLARSGVSSGKLPRVLLSKMVETAPVRPDQGQPDSCPSPSSTGCSMNTPSSATSDASTVVNDPRHGLRPAVLWPRSTFIILERGTGRALCLTEEGLRVQEMHQGQKNRWLCVEKDGYFGLTNSGRYIGHDGKFGMCASATKLNGWEFITTREHPGGGHQLLVPHWWTLRTVVVAEDGKSLVSQDHGETLWDFVKVSEH